MLVEGTLDNIDTPEALLEYMYDFEYGYVDDKGKKVKGDIEILKNKKFVENYKLLTPEESGKLKLGICYDQTEFERHIFENYIKLPFKTYYIEVEKDKPWLTHAFLVYEDQNGMPTYFENSWTDIRGLHKADSEKAVIDIAVKFIGLDDKIPMKEFTCYEFSKPNYGLNVEDYMAFCRQKKVKL